MQRRSLVLGSAGLLALFRPASATPAATSATATAKAPELWPQGAQVPGGVARLSLGPAATRPQARTEGGIPLLVLGDPIEWTALVGIPLAAAPGKPGPRFPSTWPR